MLDPAIQDFFSERKEAWLKKKIKASMDEAEINEAQLECDTLFSLEEWLPNAAKRAGQISMSTHPCTFSHPSARKNKNGYVSPVLAKSVRVNDGFVKTGNTDVDTDALGNAAALDVHKFLNLTMHDTQSLLTHIQQNTKLAKSLLEINSSSYAELKSGFLSMVENSDESVTSSKIKQVFFPVEDDYHQLSILTNSGTVYKMRERIDSLRFSDEIKELRDKKRNNEYSEHGYSEIKDLTTIGYGGTKPQNISVLNNQNGGKAHLLSSLPPNLEKRETHFPRSDFFIESFQKKKIVPLLKTLQKIIKANRNNINIRDARDYCIQEIVDQVIDKMWEVRSVSIKQYYEENSTLSAHQKIWLYEPSTQERENADDWLDKVIVDISRWIVNSYEHIFDKEAIKLGELELVHITQLVEQNKEMLR